jgi:NAD-dependent dihydropyrimidine dehydrogenase PreA subunit
MTTSVRKIVKIDEEKCNGCGDCVPSCAEGAIKIINGKARLVADNLCDGLGACLGHCPMGAITVEERPADAFDHAAVEKHLKPHPTFTPVVSHGGGCPGSQMRMFHAEPAAAAKAPSGSALRQWPVQLTLLPAQGPIWQDADVLLAADCVPFAYPDFHAAMLPGHTLAIACPKLDDCGPYVEKLATIFSQNSIRSVTVARMEVPCCFGLVRVAELALERSGRKDLTVKQTVISTRGQPK